MHGARGIQDFAGRGVVAVLAAIGVAGCDVPTDPPSGLWLEAVTSITLEGTVGQVVDPTPTVSVTGEDGVPRMGVLIRFDLWEGSGSVEVTAVETDSTGLASVGAWTLGARAGSQYLVAWVGSARIYFVATAQAGPPAEIEHVRGDGQIGDAGAPLPIALGARVLDGPLGNRVSGAPVTFTVISGGGVITSADELTDLGGYAGAAWTLGPSLGRQEVRFQSSGLEAVFTAFAACPAEEAVCGGAGTPTLAGRLAFVSTRDGNAEIYAVNADGTNLQRLTRDDASDEVPSWSPDGTRIAFVSDRTGTAQIYTMNGDGSEVAQRTWSAWGASDPSWSPDGATIAYAAHEYGNVDIWAVSLGVGGSEAPLFSLPGAEWQPSWSPDGTRLALVGDWNDFEGREDVFVVDSDGAGALTLTGGGEDPFDYSSPSWSPDGTRIALAINRRNLRDEWVTYVGVIGADGSGLLPLMAARSQTRTSWSPDGGLVAFTADGGDDPPRIAWVKADGTAGGTIVEDGRGASWRP